MAINELTNLHENYSVENHGNIILTALKLGDLKIIRSVLERREIKDNPFALTWDVSSRLEDIYYTIKTKKDYIAKGKREGIHALIEDCYQSS